MTSDRSGAGDPARVLELLWGTAAAPPPRSAANALARADRARGDRARRPRRARGGDDAAIGGSTRGGADGALHLRAGEGRAARPHARPGLRRDGAHRAGGRRLARPADRGGARQPRAVRGAPVGGGGVDRPPAAGPGADGQVRVRARRAREHGPRRRVARRGADLRPGLRAVVRARGPGGHGARRRHRHVRRAVVGGQRAAPRAHPRSGRVSDRGARRDGGRCRPGRCPLRRPRVGVRPRARARRPRRARRAALAAPSGAG